MTNSNLPPERSLEGIMSAGHPSIIPAALAWHAEGRGVALATAIQTWGSAPQPVGSQLAIDERGNFMGSVSGGCVEAAVVAEAADVLSTGRPKTLQFGVEDGTAWKVGLACGGTIRIFVEPLAERDREGAGVLQRLASDIEARREVALVTELATGARSLAHRPDELGEDLAPALADAFQHDRSIALQGRHGEVFINVFNPVTRLIVVGAVHVAQALAPMARVLGYDVLIVDPRSAFATAERFGEVSIIHDWPDEALKTLGLDPHTAVVVLSHDAKLDDAALIAALRSEAFYVGALGSRKSHAARIERLTLARIAAADIARIHTPVGLDIGARGAAEIALSIIAEVIAVQRGEVPAHR
jgi:xanthine dehydrogenase accessory factor